MALKKQTQIEVLFTKLLEGDALLGVTEILKKLIMTRDEAAQLRLIQEFQDKLDMAGPGSWHMLVHYGSEAVHMKLISEFPEKLDIKITDSIPKAGWLMLSIYGTDDVKALLMDEYAQKLESKEQIYKRGEDGKPYGRNTITVGPGWANLARYGSQAIHMKMIKEYPRKLDLNKRHGWHLLAMKGTEVVKAEVEFRRGIVRP